MKMPPAISAGGIFLCVYAGSALVDVPDGAGQGPALEQAVGELIQVNDVKGRGVAAGYGLRREKEGYVGVVHNYIVRAELPGYPGGVPRRQPQRPIWSAPRPRAR